ncbi:MAG: DUF4364 family protein [Clostridia bacterium]|nr:DUF4364 family protein [Clostridia bacterium]
MPQREYENTRFDDTIPDTGLNSIFLDDDDNKTTYADTEDQAFSGGIDPGGLRTRSDIRILICYLLNSVKAPLSAENIIEICQQKAIANYFEVIDALSSLELRGCIKKDTSLSTDTVTYYKIEPHGTAIAENLDVAIPLSVRDKAIEAATAMLAEAKMEKENSVEMHKTENGFNVTCHVSGGNSDLLSFTLYVPDIYQARMVKRNFLRNPGEIYKLILASVTGNRDLAKSLLQ